VCNASAPEFRAAYDKYQDDGFVVLSVSVQESNTAVEEFVDRYGLSYPFLLDTNGTTSLDYNVYTTPTTYFVNSDGVISAILPGIMSQQWIDQNMAAMQG
jgi:peroxiredoxin